MDGPHRPFCAMNDIAQNHHAWLALAALMRQVGELVAARKVHPARAVVLLPFFHLLPLAREAWGRHAPSGFAPRFETTLTWSAPFASAPQPQDFTGDIGRDLLTARNLLEQAGAAARADLLVSHLTEAASQLAPLASGVLPAERGAWATRMRKVLHAGMDAPQLGLESLVALVAIEWVAASTYAGDALLQPGPANDIDLLVVVESLRRDPLAQAVAQVQGEGKVVRLQLPDEGARGAITLHPAADPADEAERAAACVLQHVEAGRVPVALPAIDRVLARRIRAMLERSGVGIRDETGWKLSTTRAGAHVMLLLRACSWHTSSDQVVDWLKNAPRAASWSVLALERRVRRAGIREWRDVGAADAGDKLEVLWTRVQAWREQMQAMRTLPAWLDALRDLLGETGQWDWLERDAAGRDVIAALRLHEGETAEVAQWAQAGRRMNLAEFTSWVDDSLEATSFAACSATAEQVVILPFHQLLGRPFAALVLAGCDEVRLPAAPEPRGQWTAAQRKTLGLPTREELAQETRALWLHALRTPHCDVLWRTTDDSGEPVLPSTLVQALRDEIGKNPAEDPRAKREVELRAVPRPAAVGAMLAVEQLSASAYEDLRRCPYRFFALRQLGLHEPDEIDQELDKRDFGNWLHQVLRAFHEIMAATYEPPGPGRARLIDITADEVTREQRLKEGEFMPFRAAWPQVRDGYLRWLEGHEAKERAVFETAESEHTMPLGSLKLIGRIDRVDRLAGGHAMVMDYKTESEKKTRDRVATPFEDTQLAFYAALLSDDELRAAYVNIGERGETKTIEQTAVVVARDLLVEGIQHDLARIARGEAMQALGEGAVCDFCAARGLCRRDFWS